MWLAFCIALRAASPAAEPTWQLHFGGGAYGRALPVYASVDARAGLPQANATMLGPVPPMGPMRAFLLGCP